MTMRYAAIAIVGLGAGIAALWGWHWTHPRQATDTLNLYGNVDLRQADLAFNGNERIAAVLVQEGDRVHKGEVLARLDTSRLDPQVAQAQAQTAAQHAVVE